MKKKRKTYSKKKSKFSPGILVLENGQVFKGIGLGYEGLATGEVCFNTSITGYQEIISDPSYSGQIINFTFPHIGNVGTNKEDHESDKIWTKGVIFNAEITNPSNYRALKNLDIWLKKNKIVGLTGVDTTPQPPDESAVKASFGGKSGSGGMGAGGAAGLGALAALLKLGLFGKKGKFGEESEDDEAAAAALEEQRKNVEKRLLTLEGGDMTLANAAKSTAMLGTRIRNRVVEGQRGFLNVENPMNTFRRARDGAIDASKIQIKPQGVDTAGQMVVADGPDAGNPVAVSYTHLTLPTKA